MPTPNPKENESQPEFIARCMEWSGKNESDMPQEQQLAMCYSVFRKGRGSDIKKSELMKELLFEKDRLAGIVERIGDGTERDGTGPHGRGEGPGGGLGCDYTVEGDG